jgi:ribonucleoside-diphosphate reductase alpha chain
MGFLKIGDRAAGAIKSGGTTRRAAKMVICRCRPPGYRGVHQLEGQGRAEGRLLVAGSKMHEAKAQRDLRAIGQWDGDLTTMPTIPAKNAALKGGDPRRQEGAIPETYVKRVLDYARQGYTSDRVPDL